MYIQHIPTTTHLKPVSESLRAIKHTLSDREWHGLDCSAERLEFDRLQRLVVAGVRYEPTF